MEVGEKGGKEGEGMTGIKIEQAAIASCRTYHVPQPLISSGGVVRRAHDGGNSGNSGLGDLLLEIPGVNTVYVSRYSVDIHKAELFDWDEIEPGVMERLRPFGG